MSCLKNRSLSLFESATRVARGGIVVYAAAALLLPGMLRAQAVPSAGSAEEDAIALDRMTVTASADASAEGLTGAFAGGQVARGGRVGVFGSLDHMATPFSVTAYTQELIQNQQAASVGEVLLNDPAVRVARGFGNFQQLYMVRGLPVYSDDMAYNGLYGLLPRQYLAAELVERVEVLRGANAFLNGAAPGGSGLGGAVNVMPKRAPSAPLTQFTAGVQSGGQLYAAADVGRRFADERLGLRLTAAQRDGNTAVDGESTQLGLVALGADFCGERFRISADVGYQDLQKDATQPSVTINPGLAIPDAPDASQSVAQGWTFSNERDVFGTVRTEFDVTDRITVWLAGGAREGDEVNSFANPTVVDAMGTTSSYRFDNVREEVVVTGEVGVRARFETGGATHRLSVSASAYDLESKNAYAFSSFAGFAGNLYAPFDVAAPDANFFVGGSMSDPLVTQKGKTSSFAVADAVGLFDDRLIVLAGLRHQEIESSSYDYNTGAELSSYSDDAVTPSVGVLYKFTPRLSGYVNYIEGLTQGDVAPANSGGVAVINAGEVLAPYVTEQYEVGVKLDLGRLGGAVSVFQSEKPISGVDASGRFGVVDDQRNRGLELSAYGLLSDDFKVLGGVSLLDADVDAKDSIGSPETQLNLGWEWITPWVRDLSLDGRVIHTSSQYADAANTQQVPSWTRLDLGLRQQFAFAGETRVTVRARVENVTDEDYWASAGGYPGAGYLTIGAPRTFILSASFNF